MVVLSVCLAALLALSLRWLRLDRAAARACARRVQRQEIELFEALRTLIAAARRGSADVLKALDAAVRGAEPRIDAVLTFVPVDDELHCVRASGERASYYAGLRIARVPPDAPVGLLLPTDRAAIALPMVDEGGLRAMVYASSRCDWRDRPPSIARIVDFAVAPYAIALEREADRDEATYDSLTGLLAPRAFRARLRDEIARAQSGEGPALSVWFLDTDGFKGVNDTFGHAAGDRVLQQMGALLRRHLHLDLDVGARNGGDEFCALVRGVPKTRSVLRACELCAEVRRTDFGIATTLSASIGVAAFPSDATNASDLLELADGAMYHSKRSGRDRVSFAVGPERFVVAQ